MEFTEESSGEQRSTFKKKKFNPYAYQVGLLFLFGLLWHGNKWKNYSFGVKQANPSEYNYLDWKRSSLFQSRYVTPGFKPFSYNTNNLSKRGFGGGKVGKLV